MEQESLSHLRHTLAHLLAAAVLRLYPDAKPTIGPAIDNGFYYDFDFSAPLSSDDLKKIEQEMRGILKTWESVSSKVVTGEEALEVFKNNQYKQELIREIVERGEDVTLYTWGEFQDLCRGGHAENATAIDPECFSLTHLAGAYWKGSEKNAMLTRIYGLAFSEKEELDAHLTLLAEAEKRDHRKLGKELDLFTFSELVGPGLALWTPRGTLIRNLLDEFIWSLRREKGYQRVTIPHITKKALYETSGHWQKFSNDLFKVQTREGHEFALKPMSCPHHTQIFARKPHSYREMPQRYAETTMVYRDEQTGELHGLSRVLCITQDDAHVFCRISQMKDEILTIWNIVNSFYATVGFEQLKVRLSFHDAAKMENYLGTEDIWQRTEDSLRDIAKERGVHADEAIGEAAFYGPKLDFVATDSIGRSWQVATIQVDFNLPERFDLSCTNEEGSQERIVMIHAAIMGSLERFLSVYIEHCAGAFPVWLSPVQVQIIPVGLAHGDACRELAEQLSLQSIRTFVDESNESVGKKIRNAEKQKVPYMIVIGDKEKDLVTVSVRKRGEKDTQEYALNDFITHAMDKIEHKSLDL
ncbi:MAG: threonine--tRNA ligase [Candidatus Uhrbacteria bacterium]|nr:threonine--tRNA ligase [Candidatus Uhrbacteria bacterium]